jgi:GntR family transcriptional regulator
MEPASFVPRYYEIEQELRTQIAALRSHDPLPSDAELCEQFGVSRMTARNAMQRLVHEGLVYREKGRGTFVSPRVVDREVSHLRGFSDEMRARGMVPSSILLGAALRQATEAEATALRQRPGVEVVSIERVRLADDVPMAVEHAVLTARCAGVLVADLAQASLHRTLMMLGIVPSSGTSTVTAERPTARDAAQLRITRNTPLLVERRLIRDGENVPIEWTESRYVSERFALNVSFAVDLPPARPADTRAEHPA